MSEGEDKGQVCNRDGCKGIIEEYEKEGSCSCHSCPPCGYCTEDNRYCPECDWKGGDDYIPPVSQSKPFEYKTASELYKEFKGDKIQCVSMGHTHFSMRLKGKMPRGTTMEEVLPHVRGTFGGRFESFTETTFEYIAYTD